MIEPTGQPEVDVDRLAKTYPGGTEAVRGISFQVRAGEVFGLLGPNTSPALTLKLMPRTASVPPGYVLASRSTSTSGWPAGSIMIIASVTK